MKTEHSKNGIHKHQVAGASESIDDADAQTILERGAEAYGQAEQAVGDVYDKTARAVSETYEQTRSYSSENPGKTILVALGVGVALGFFLGASSRHSRSGRFARPVVNVLSDIAHGLFG